MVVRVFGWYGQHNVGDEAFKLCFAEGFRRLGVQPDIVYSANGFGAVPHVILGGGEVVRPYYLDRIDPGTEIYALGVGLGGESEVELLRHRRLATALFRSRHDVVVANAAGIDAIYCPDLTFILPDVATPPLPRADERKRLGVLLTDEINPTWEGQSYREYLYYEYFKWELAATLDELAQYYRIAFIPLSMLDSIDDRTVHQDVFRRMRRRASAILHAEECSVPQARLLIASCDLVVSMKYHGILFAVQAGVPFINIAATRKAHLFCHENGLGRLTIPAFSLQRERLLEVVRFAEGAECRSDVRQAAQQLKAEAAQTFPRVLALYVQHALTP